MSRHLVGGIYVVEAKKDGITEHWAAATLRENAVAAVEKELGRGWIAILMDHRLASQQLSTLKMRPNTVRKL